MNKKIGIKLKESRLDQTLSIEKVSGEIFIRKHILIALEEGDYSLIPSIAQVRGFIRSYGEYLGLDSEELLESLENNQLKPLISEDNNKTDNDNTIGKNDKNKEMETIFHEIGEGIKNRRELLGLSLEDIETHTHIPINYLRFVESGSFNKFPSPTQARGMLGNYTKFLDMDKHSVMLRYADALQSKLQFVEDDHPKKVKKSPESNTKLKLPLWLKYILSADTFVFGILGIATIIFAIWGINHVLGIQANTAVKPTAPALSGLLLPSPTASKQPAATESTTDIIIPSDPITQPNETSETPTIQAFVGENIEIYVIVFERTYLRVIVDGNIEFDGRAIPGSNLPFTAIQNLEILTGNGSAIQIFYNGDDIGPLGNTGEVVHVIYTRNGIIYPTPTPALPTMTPSQETDPPIFELTEVPTN